MSDRWQALSSKYEIKEVFEKDQIILIKALDIQLQRLVAIKTPADAIQIESDTYKNFIEEAQKLARIQHENVVSVLHIYQPGDIDNNCYLVTEWLDKTLADILRSPINPDGVYGIVKKLLNGIGAIQAAGITHIGISPDKILIAENGKKVKIGDLGIAAGTDSEATMPTAPDFKYASPESGKAVTLQSDLYPIGLMAYEMLLGQARFKEIFTLVYAVDDAKIQSRRWLTWHQDESQKAPLLHTIDADITPELSDYVARLMAKNLAERVSNVASASHALEILHGSQQVASRVVTLPIPEDKLDDKKLKMLFAGGAGFIVVLLLVVAVMLFGSKMGDLDPIIESMVAAKAGAVEDGADEGISAFVEAEKLREKITVSYKEKEYDETKAQILVAIDTYYEARRQALDRAEKRRKAAKKVMVPVGTFYAGSTEQEIEEALSLCKKNKFRCKKDRFNDETYQKSVVTPFIINAHEITNQQFANFVEETKYQTDAEKMGYATLPDQTAGKGFSWKTPNGPGTTVDNNLNHPVVAVSVYDAMAYCRWANGRLPTASEWEYAARGPDHRIYPWGNSWDESKAHWYSSDSTATNAVGSFPKGATPEGVNDLAGSVWEWTQSKDGEKYILKGGSRLDKNPTNLRTAGTLKDNPIAAHLGYGFRCVKNMKQWPQDGSAIGLIIETSTQREDKRPPGTFFAGSSAGDIAAAMELCKQYTNYCSDQWFNHEVRREVTLKPFVIDIHEVTNQDFETFVKASNHVTDAERKGFALTWVRYGLAAKETMGLSWINPEGANSSYNLRMTHPVVNVSSNDAQAYCQWAGKRLPTADEWEYAARGVYSTIFPWGNEWQPTYALWANGGDKPTRPIASFTKGATPEGVFDLAGSVSEWTATRTREGNLVVRKGGSRLEPNPAFLRSAAIRKEEPDAAYSDTGIRCAEDRETWPNPSELLARSHRAIDLIHNPPKPPEAEEVPVDDETATPTGDEKPAADGGSVVDGAAPADAAPADAAPVDAAPVDAAPVDAAPVDAAPVDAAPADASPKK